MWDFLLLRCTINKFTINIRFILFCHETTMINTKHTRLTTVVGQAGV